MNFSYRTIKNARIVSEYWGKSLDKPNWYEIKSLSEDSAEIIIMDVIGWPFVDANELIRELSGMNQKTITVRINSPGGDCFDAFGIYNALQSHKSKIITRVEGIAASCASFILLAGKEVQAYQNAMVMLHEPWCCAVGNQHELMDMAGVLNKVNGNMIDIYAGHSNLGKREWKDMLEKGETWWTAKEAKEHNFIDSIIDGKSAKACFDLSMYANVPEEIRGEGRESTEREKERALRDVGFSQQEAKAILAGRKAGKPAGGDNQRDVESLRVSMEALLSKFKKA